MCDVKGLAQSDQSTLNSAFSFSFTEPLSLF